MNLPRPLLGLPVLSPSLGGGFASADAPFCFRGASADAGTISENSGGWLAGWLALLAGSVGWLAGCWLAAGWLCWLASRPAGWLALLAGSSGWVSFVTLTSPQSVLTPLVQFASSRLESGALNLNFVNPSRAIC